MSMRDFLSRRRFLETTVCYAGLSAILQGCGSGETTGNGPPIVVVPAPTPTPTPAPPSTPTPPSGEVITIAFAGSSSTEQYLSLYSGSLSNPSVTVSSDGINFTSLNMGAFGKSSGDKIAKETGRHVRFVRGGIGGTTLDQWASDTSLQRAALVQKIRAAGGVSIILIQIGRNDAATLLITNQESQENKLTRLISLIRTESSSPEAFVFIGGSQDILNSSPMQRLQLGWQRLAEVNVASRVFNTRYAYSTYDLKTFDQVHQTEESQILSGMRFANQVISLYQTTPEQRGPRIIRTTSVSQNYTDIEISHAGGTDIFPARNINGFRISLENEIDEISILSAERRGPTTVRVGHEARGNRRVRLSYAITNDVSDENCLRDNSDARLPAEPYASALF